MTTLFYWFQFSLIWYGWPQKIACIKYNFILLWFSNLSIYKKVYFLIMWLTFLKSYHHMELWVKNLVKPINSAPSNSITEVTLWKVHVNYCEDVAQVVGFDWVLLFVQENLHPTTVVWGLRILATLLSLPQLMLKFRTVSCWNSILLL